MGLPVLFAPAMLFISATNGQHIWEVLLITANFLNCLGFNSAYVPVDMDINEETFCWVCTNAAYQEPRECIAMYAMFINAIINEWIPDDTIRSLPGAAAKRAGYLIETALGKFTGDDAAYNKLLEHITHFLAAPCHEEMRIMPQSLISLKDELAQKWGFVDGAVRSDFFKGIWEKHVHKEDCSTRNQYGLSFNTLRN